MKGKGDKSNQILKVGKQMDSNEQANLELRTLKS